MKQEHRDGDISMVAITTRAAVILVIPLSLFFVGWIYMCRSSPALAFAALLVITLMVYHVVLSIVERLLE